MSRIEAQKQSDALRLELEKLNRLYAMLSRINRTIVRAEDAGELYEAVCRIAVEYGSFTCAWAGLVDPSSQCVVLVARAGAPAQWHRVEISVADAADPIGAALRENRPFRVDGSRIGPELPSPWPEVMRDVGVAGLAVLPLQVEGELVGAFGVATGESGYFQEPVTRLLIEIAEDISFALEVLRREERRAIAESKIQYLAHYDPQTGLPSRTLFTERLAAACEAAGEQEITVLVVALRQYHAVMQAVGDKAGLQLMRIVSGRLESLLPFSAIGRIAESEFAVIAEITDGLHLVEETAWGIHQVLSQAIPVDGREFFLSPFTGIAVYPRNGAPSEVLKAAALAAAKGPQDAGSVCRFFVAGMDRVSRERLEMEAAMRRALERQEFVLHFQPQVSLESGCVVGAEALLRWQRPGHGLVPPSEFIPLLEDTGLIVPVGEWVMQEACRFAKQCQDEGLPPFRVAVNLSARQFQEGDVGAMTRRALSAAGLEAHWLEMEITESIVLLSAEAVIRTISELKAAGVKHALDDFGTGYSSLSYLQRLPVDRIKIDQGFVANVTSNPNDAGIVRAVVGMAHNLGLAVIAEGVETEGQLGFLRGLQCEEMQGYHFSRPLPGDEFRALLKEGRRIAGAPAEDRPGRYILVLDDEPNVLSALRRLLRPTDLNLLIAGNVQEAFNLLATHPVGVVVCDQRMPEMTGTEFLRRVKELHPAVVRIVLSGYTDLTSVIDAVNRGAIYKFLTKPWDDQALIDSLKEAFRLYEMERENRELVRRIQQLIKDAGKESAQRPDRRSADGL